MFTKFELCLREGETISDGEIAGKLGATWLDADGGEFFALPGGGKNQVFRRVDKKMISVHNSLTDKAETFADPVD